MMRIKMKEIEWCQLLVKFILNLPDKETNNDRIIYHMLQAYHYCLREQSLTQFQDNKLKQEEECQFICRFNQEFPDFLRYTNQELLILKNLQRGICVCGIFLVNQYHEVLLVQDIRTGKYGFPKGKLAQQQSYLQCAIRQLKQETGIILSESMVKQKRYFDKLVPRDQDLYFFMAVVRKRQISLQNMNKHQIKSMGWVYKQDVGDKNLNIVSRMMMDQLIVDLKPKQYRGK